MKCFKSPILVALFGADIHMIPEILDVLADSGIKTSASLASQALVVAKVRDSKSIVQVKTDNVRESKMFWSRQCFSFQY